MALELAGKTVENVLGETSGSKDINSLKQMLEPEYWTQFRQALMGGFGQEYDKLQKPIFGAPQIAQYGQSLNDLAQKSIASLSSGLARKGMLNSGLFGQGMGDIQTSKLSNMAQFLAQLPFQEEQTRRSGIGNMLGLGAQWAGAAPGSEAFTGAENSESSTDTTTTTENYAKKKPWWQSLLEVGLGAGTKALGLGMGNMFSNKGFFGGTKTPTTSGYGAQ